MTTVAFRVLVASLRGTEVAIYDYAVANEEILGNTSIILIRMSSDHNQEVIHKFKRRFCVYFYNSVLDIENTLKSHKCRVLYTIAYGERRVNDPTLSINNVYKTALHCVFSMADPHADTYVPISDYLAKKYGSSTPSVPHMITLKGNSNLHMRKCNYGIRKGLKYKSELGIPSNAIVFGRYGGYETFNILYVHQVISAVVNKCKNVYFIFANTYKFINHPQVLFLAPIVNNCDKIAFIMACDAMIHARADGETFGIACGEFSICNKPVITCKAGDTSHIDILGNKCILYKNGEHLEDILTNFLKVKIEKENLLISLGYDSKTLWDAYSELYSPEFVIKLWWAHLIEPCLK